ncbi:MAG TPA: PQQ-dependent dehydrogenase, methanol/ethanol family [Candidatus Acidoferrales bacterium]|nr:PQQ-dependent dehydrogenase, methanol/ethanol family [Candidatus Acidoferrales bacterium]
MRRTVLEAVAALAGIGAALLLCIGTTSTPRAATDPFPPVTDGRLLNAGSDDGWLMFLRTYNGQAHAPFTQINTSNVSQLQEVFTHEVTIPQGFEAPPIVNGRTMIVTTPMDHVYALDATNGKLLWEYDYHVPKRQLRTVCCDVVNRGVALYGTNAYLATLDNHVLALDARTGKLQWNHRIYPLPGEGYAMTLAPLAADGKIIVGESGGEYGIRGFIVALDPATGKELWRRYTIPGPGEPNFGTYPGQTYRHGGGGAWLTGTFDPQTQTLYWGVGNPSPWLAAVRPGRNLYSDSVLALDVATGKVKWYFQQTPNDSWDYDATNTPVLADITIHGKLRKVFYQAARNGWFYVVDRTDGSLINMTPFTKTTSVTGYDRARRIGLTDASKRPQIGKTIFTCPAFFGGDNWWPYSFDPQTGYAYVPTMKTCMTLGGLKPEKFQAGAQYVEEKFVVEHVPGSNQWGELQAIDVATGRRVWAMNTQEPWNDGTLSTDGGLVFSGTPDQKFYAFDAKTGRILWMHHMTSGVIGVPMSYRVDGKQYIAVQSGWGGVAPFYGGKKMTPSFRGIRLGGRLYVFSLPDASPTP